MRRSTRAAVGCAMLLALAGSARAQSVSSDKLSVNVNLGYQTQSRDLTGNGTYSIYDEDATFATSQQIKSGLIFDVSADYQVMDRVAIGVGWTTFSSTSSARVDAQVPHPVFYGQFRTASAETGGVEHHANAININAVFRYPLSGKMDVVASAGPSIVMVNQDLVTGVTVRQESAPSFSSPSIDSITVAAEKKTVMGFNAGADFVSTCWWITAG